jgi:aldose 1-epimerase
MPAPTPTSPETCTLIPTGELAPVAGTPLDFRRPTAIGERIRVGFDQLVKGRGYDHNWMLDRKDSTSLERAAKVTDRRNEPNFRSVVLRPGQTYQTTTVYKFSTD